jgi:glutamate-1-semialdehyde 2,1-aminomutase
MRAGLAAMKEYAAPGFFNSLGEKTAYLCQGLRKALPDSVIPHRGGMFSIGFGVTALRDHEDAFRLDTERFARFFHAALREGVYLPPSTFDAAALSSAHSQQDLDLALEKLGRAASVL